VIVAYQDALFHGALHPRRGLLAAGLVAVLLFAAGAFLFDRLRETLAEQV
jgi:hypothetical protein